MTKPRPIRCPACGEETLLKREPVFEGFRRVGETLSCLSCGEPFADEEAVPYVDARRPQIFTEDERSPTVDVLDAASGPPAICRHCEHYVVNPFIQRCNLHQRIVEATDTCPDFARREDDADDAGAADTPSAD